MQTQQKHGANKFPHSAVFHSRRLSLCCWDIPERHRGPHARIERGRTSAPRPSAEPQRGGAAGGDPEPAPRAPEAQRPPEAEPRAVGGTCAGHGALALGRLAQEPVPNAPLGLWGGGEKRMEALISTMWNIRQIFTLKFQNKNRRA